MVEHKSSKKTWILFCLLLFSPFIIEIPIFLITLNLEPQYIWRAIRFIYCYIVYGAACFIYLKWQKRTNWPVNIKPGKQDLKWLCFALIMGICVKHIFQIIAVYIFDISYIHIAAPMIYRDFIWYLKDDSLLLGLGGFIMQYIYYVFEFALIALIVDCAQKTSMRMGWTQKIPWGGIFLILTTGLAHRFGVIPSALRGEFAYGIQKILQCLTIGLAYTLPGKKPVYAFFAMLAWYWL